MYRKLFILVLCKSIPIYALWNLGGIENSSNIVLQNLCYGDNKIISSITLHNYIKFPVPYWVGKSGKGVNKMYGVLPDQRKIEISFDGCLTGFLKRKHGIPVVQGKGYKKTAGAQDCQYGKKCARVFIEIEGVLHTSFYRQFEPDQTPTYILCIKQNNGIYSLDLQ